MVEENSVIKTQSSSSGIVGEVTFRDAGLVKIDIV
jgi:hypothetical protein